VGGGHRVELGQLRSEAGVTGCGGTGDERDRGRAERAELFLGHALGAQRPAGCRPRPAVVGVGDGRLTGGDDKVVGDHLTGRGVHQQQPISVDDDLDGGPDQPHRDGVAGRAEPDRGEPVHLPGDRGRADPQLQ